MLHPEGANTAPEISIADLNDWWLARIALVWILSIFRRNHWRVDHIVYPINRHLRHWSTAIERLNICIAQPDVKNGRLHDRVRLGTWRKLSKLILELQARSPHRLSINWNGAREIAEHLGFLLTQESSLPSRRRKFSRIIRWGELFFTQHAIRLQRSRRQVRKNMCSGWIAQYHFLDSILPVNLLIDVRDARSDLCLNPHAIFNCFLRQAQRIYMNKLNKRLKISLLIVRN